MVEFKINTLSDMSYGTLLGTAAVCAGTYILTTWLRRWLQFRAMPPGPGGWPLIGSLPHFRNGILEGLTKLVDKYGDVMTIYLGRQPVVVLSSHEAIREAFVTHSHAFSGRVPSRPVIREFAPQNGLLVTEGALWRQHRSFTLKVLRDFGVGRNLMEEKILIETSHLLATIESNNGEAFNPHDLLLSAVTNTISLIVYGQRYDYDDQVFVESKENTKVAFKAAGYSSLISVFSFLRYLPGDPFEIDLAVKLTNRTKNKRKMEIQEHKNTRTPNQTRDLVDAYLDEWEKETDMGTSIYSDEHLLALAGDVYGAGTETTTTTLLWALIYLLHHPDIQTRVQSEIEEVIGDRAPSMLDVRAMPYTEAVLLEVQRLSSVVPLGVPHRTTEQVALRGYTIPANTRVISLLHSVHRDHRHWSNPEEFNPGRFLDHEGKVVRNESLLPFSIGKRSCVGESLARMELFLIFTRLLQRINIKNPPDKPLPSLKGTVYVTNTPPSFEVIMETKSQ